jgi:hypothetical protein
MRRTGRQPDRCSPQSSLPAHSRSPEVRVGVNTYVPAKRVGNPMLGPGTLGVLRSLSMAGKAVKRPRGAPLPAGRHCWYGGTFARPYGRRRRRGESRHLGKRPLWRFRATAGAWRSNCANLSDSPVPSGSSGAGTSGLCHLTKGGTRGIGSLSSGQRAGRRRQSSSSLSSAGPSLPR